MPGPGGKPNTQMIEEFGVLGAGEYTLHAEAGTFIDNDVPPSLIAEASFDFTFEASSACLADLDQDDVVGAADLADLLAAWGPNPGDPADFNGDGVVDAADLAQLLSAWGPRL